MKSFLSAAALAAAALCASATANAAIVISFVPTASHINVGDTTEVAMTISGLDAEILSAFDINMLFNDSVLFNNSVTHNIAVQWPGGGIFGPSVFNPGNTEVIDYAYDDDATLAASQANAFTVLTFGFTGVADGASFINLGLNPDFERNFVGLNSASLTVEIGSACVSVGTGSCGVPEPGSYSLAAVGLLAAGFAGRARRRNARTAA